MDVDLRIRKSKHHLRKSIIKLLQSVQFSDINISMICKEANVSRVTFYNYYKNKTELLEDIVKIILNSTIKKTRIETGNKKINLCYFQCLLINIIDICYKYEKIIPAMKTIGNLDLRNVIDNYFYDEILNSLKKFIKINNMEMDPYIATSLIVGGFARMIFDWIRLPSDKQREDSREKLEKSIKLLFKQFSNFAPKRGCEVCDTKKICPIPKIKYEVK